MGNLYTGLKGMNKNIARLLVISLITLVSACGGQPSNSSSVASSSSSTKQVSSSSIVSSSSKKDYVDNQLSTNSGLVVKFKAEGATIDSIKWNNTTIADRGFVVGRCANRIANGRFTLDGQTYNVSINDRDSNSSLHGGTGSGMYSWRGPFATKDWTLVEQTASTIEYKIESPDGENGYPGKMTMNVKYTLSQAGELLIEYTATTTKDTLCNPTNHLFMRMNGTDNYSSLKLWINANQYTPRISNTNKLPDGTIYPVAGTVFDYTTERAFDGSKSYDDNLVLDGTGYRKVATMTGTTLGVKVDVFTDRPGMQLYNEGSGNVCLETQMLPDAINHDNFESPILKAGETFYSKTAYCFSSIN